MRTLTKIQEEDGRAEKIEKEVTKFVAEFLTENGYKVSDLSGKVDIPEYFGMNIFKQDIFQETTSIVLFFPFVCWYILPDN